MGNISQGLINLSCTGKKEKERERREEHNREKGEVRDKWRAFLRKLNEAQELDKKTKAKTEGKGSK